MAASSLLYTVNRSLAKPWLLGQEIKRQVDYRQTLKTILQRATFSNKSLVSSHTGSLSIPIFRYLQLLQLVHTSTLLATRRQLVQSQCICHSRSLFHDIIQEGSLFFVIRSTYPHRVEKSRHQKTYGTPQFIRNSSLRTSIHGKIASENSSLILCSSMLIEAFVFSVGSFRHLPKSLATTSDRQVPVVHGIVPSDMQSRLPCTMGARAQ